MKQKLEEAAKEYAESVIEPTRTYWSGLKRKEIDYER